MFHHADPFEHREDGAFDAVVEGGVLAEFERVEFDPEVFDRVGRVVVETDGFEFFGGVRCGVAAVAVVLVEGGDGGWRCGGETVVVEIGIVVVGNVVDDIVLAVLVHTEIVVFGVVPPLNDDAFLEEGGGGIFHT